MGNLRMEQTLAVTSQSQNYTFVVCSSRRYRFNLAIVHRPEWASNFPLKSAETMYWLLTKMKEVYSALVVLIANWMQTLDTKPYVIYCHHCFVDSQMILFNETKLHGLETITWHGSVLQSVNFFIWSIFFRHFVELICLPLIFHEPF